MILKSAKFVTSAAKVKQCPEIDMAEVAFAGRSNVGKSSLMNMLLRRKRLVKVSNTPGRTQLLNYFLINNEFHLVDLPGYGFAKAPKSVRRNWEDVISEYLATRAQLAAVVLLLDIRRKPNADDIGVIQMFQEQGLPCILAITKADKLPLQKRKKQIFAIAKSLGLEAGDCIMTSALKSWGRDELWSSIECFLEAPQEEYEEEAEEE